MTKDEMKNRISMALKDPVLQQGFEIMCKENAELKKLRCCENCKNVNLQLHWRDNKEINEQRMFKCGNCRNRVNWEFGGKTVGISETQQLTKAKEIIKDYMIIVKGDHTTVCSVPEENRCINVLKLNEKAEQFLKEV